MTGVFSFWRGDISWVERCSAASMAAHGLKLTVFTPDVARVRNSGLVADVRDAREVLDDPSIDWLLKWRPDHWSDIFRVEGLAQGHGTWVDLDLIFVKPLPRNPYLIGRNGSGINTAVLRLPLGSPVLVDYLKVCRRRPLPLVGPFEPLACRALGHINIARKRLFGRRLPPPALGGGTLKRIIERCGFEAELLPQHVFYPVPIKDVELYYQDAAQVDAMLAPDTVTVHLWNRQFTNRFGRSPPPRGSWLGQTVQRYEQQRELLIAAE